MEALASYTFASRLAEPYPSRHSCCSSLPKFFPSVGQRFFKIEQNFEPLSLFSHRGGFRAVAREVFRGGEGEDWSLGNGSAFNELELECTIGDVGTSKMIVAENEVTKPSFNGSTTKAGLFRTPISGGVHSATSCHDLPPPALAVRNLMEQARFAHLCTIMSRMHHRRAGYPCGSLVDFATDSVGHPIFSLSTLAIHTRNVLVDPKCTLVVQIPGWSGLSNARVTIFGDVIPVPADKQI